MWYDDDGGDGDVGGSIGVSVCSAVAPVFADEHLMVKMYRKTNFFFKKYIQNAKKSDPMMMRKQGSVFHSM